MLTFQERKLRYRELSKSPKVTQVESRRFEAYYLANEEKTYRICCQS